MRSTLTDSERHELDALMSSVNMSTILSWLTTKTYEAEDSVGSGMFGQMASAIFAAQLLCQYLEREMGLDSGEECE